MKFNRYALLGSLFALLLCTSAMAHPGHDVGSGLGAGLRHPLSGIDHILAMIAVGLWASQIGGRALWMLPSTFIGLMILGGSLSMGNIQLPLVEQGIMTSVLVLGLMIALAVKPPISAMVAMVGAFAVFHGYAHVAEMNAGDSPAAYALGFIIATAILHAAGIALGFGMKRALSRRLLQAVGGAIAGCGLLLFLHVL